MKKRILTALLSLATIVGTAFAISNIPPSLGLEPGDGSVVTVMPEMEYYFAIYFTHTDALFVDTNSIWGPEELPIDEEHRNSPNEYCIYYYDILYEYDIEKDYRIRAINESGRTAIALITYKTFPNLHDR
jgi:hypothetical protein